MKRFAPFHLLRFKLRSLLILLTLCCCGLGWHIHGTRQQKSAVEAIRAYGATVRYSFQVDEETVYNPHGQSWAPDWARQLLGDDFFHPTVEVNFLYAEGKRRGEWSDRRDLAPLEYVAKLPNLRVLCLYGPQIDGSNAHHLSRLRSLERFTVKESYKLTDSEMSHLISDRLKVVQVGVSQVTDRTLESLSHRPNLEYLDIFSHHFTDKGASHLHRLKNLRELTMIGGEPSLAITDASLQFLLELPDLRTLNLRNTHVSDGFIQQLRARFPNASIVSYWTSKWDGFLR